MDTQKSSDPHRLTLNSAANSFPINAKRRAVSPRLVCPTFLSPRRRNEYENLSKVATLIFKDFLRINVF